VNGSPLGWPADPPSSSVLPELTPGTAFPWTSASNLSSRPDRPLERLSTLRAVDAAFGSGSVSAVLRALRLGLGLRFVSASRRSSGTRRILVSPGEAGGSPWLRDHFDTAFRRDNRGVRNGCARTGA